MFVRMKKYARLIFWGQSAFELKYVPGEMTMKYQVFIAKSYTL